MSPAATAAARTFKEIIRPAGCAPSASSIHDLTVVTYNLLADKFATPDMHPQCPPSFLSWEYRAPRLLQELTSYAADILCLQEVELPFLEETLRPELHRQGYTTLYYGRKRSKHDTIKGPQEGVCLCYRTGRLQQLAEGTVRLGDFVASNIPSNVSSKRYSSFLTGREDGAALALLRDTTTDRTFVACSTHLFWNPAFPDIKAGQAHLLCAAIRDFAVRHGAATQQTLSSLPVILGGDFNSLPWKTNSDAFDAVPPGGKLVSGVYEMLARGVLDALHPHHPAVRRPASAAPLQSLHLGTGGLQLKSATVDAWGSEPSFTNRTAGFTGCLDYIFMSPQHWKVTEILEMPYTWDPAAPEHVLDAPDEAMGVIPDERWPSDHVAVGVKLRWSDQ